MDGLLGNNGTLVTAMGKITDEFNAGGANSFAKKIADTIKTPAALDFSAEYTKFKNAVTASTDIIDEALNSNDLTELDTSNLRALRSYLTETLVTVDAAIKDSGLSATGNNQQADVTKEKLEKIQAGLNSDISKAAMEELLGVDGADGTVGKQLKEITKALNTTDGIQKIVADAAAGSRVIIMTEANSSVKSKVLKLLPKLKTEETDSLCVA